VTSNLGVALASFGIDVTLIDADVAMANLELVLGLEDKPTTLNDVLSGEADIHDAIYEGPGGVKVIPAGISLDSLQKVKLNGFKDVVNSILPQTDIVLIDAPAGLGKNALAAIEAAGEMILVTTPEVTAISDALKTRMVANELGVEILGAVINRERNDRTLLTTKEIEIVLKLPIIAKIHEDPDVGRSAAFAEPVILKNPNSTTYNPIMQLAAHIIDRDFQPVVADKKGLISKLIEGVMGKRDKVTI